MRRAKTPSVSQYAELKKAQQDAARELTLELLRTTHNELRAARVLRIISAAHVHKLRAQRRYLDTPEQCRRRLRIATDERTERR